MEGRWKLVWGIHKGTITSRDTGESVNNLESLAECRRVAVEKRKEFARAGYALWYATAVAPDGARHQLNELIGMPSIRPKRPGSGLFAKT